MKKLVLVFAFLSFLYGHAQEQADTIGGKKISREWIRDVNKKFSNLDVRKIPHGLLLDRAMEFTNLTAYNGTLSDSTKLNITQLSNMFKTLAMARVKDSTGIPAMETYAENWAVKRLNYNQQEQNTIVLSGLYFKYARISPTALDERKIKVVQDRYEEVFVNNLWQNPYEELETLGIVPPIDHYNQNNFKIILPRELWLSNGNIATIEIDVKDGRGFQVINFDQPLQVNYSTNNETYEWQFRVTLADNRQLLSAALFTINDVVTTSLTNGANNVFIPYNNESIIAEKGAMLRIDYASADGQLRRPLIVVEGFDSGNITAPEVVGGDRTLSDFNFDIAISSSNQLNTLLNSDQQEYDIIYVDWQNGTNDIRHNSRVLKNVITWVNTHKVGTQSNVVLGQSMGGLVGRYTLAKMEQDGQTHNVRLFIAHDSPLQGANTPISTQFFTRHLYDQYVDSGTGYVLGEYIVPVIFGIADLMSSIINSAGGNTTVDTYVNPEALLTIQDTPAAVQLNYHYVDGFSRPQKIFHQVWQQEFDAMGYPSQCRNIAISNGSECAPSQGFQPRDKFISFHKDSGNYFGLLNDLAYMFGSAALGVAISNYTLAIVGLLPGSSKFYYDFDIHANPKLTDTNRRVYNGKITYRKKFLWLVPITVTIMKREKNAPQGYEPFDIYSGGFFDISNVAEQIQDGLPLPLSLTGIYVNQQFNFIPVVSALDIKRNNGPVAESDYYKKFAYGTLPAGLTSSFQNFIVGYDNGASTNYRHISFQARNGNWLAQELQVNSVNPVYPDYNCSKFCSNSTITGSTFLCTTGNYSVTSEATTVSWFISSGFQYATLSNSSSTTATLTATGTSSGFVTLVATYSNQRCGSATVQLQIWVGKPKYISQQLQNAYDNVSVNTNSNLSVLPTLGNQEYYWTITENSTSCGCTTNSDGLTICPSGTVKPRFPNGSTISYTSTSQYANISWGNCTGTYIVNCFYKNPCGLTGINYKFVNVYSSNGGGNSDPCEGQLQVYPNPINTNRVTNEISVNITYPSNPPCNNPPLYNKNEVKIYDFSGNLLFSQDYTNDDIKVSNLNLDKGNYILNVFTNKGFQKREIILVE